MMTDPYDWSKDWTPPAGLSALDLARARIYARSTQVAELFRPVDAEVTS